MPAIDVSRQCPAPTPPRSEGRARVVLHPELGGPPARVDLRYRLLGDPGLGTRLVSGGISASHRADGDGGWWPGQVGPGRALDPAEGAVLCVQHLDHLPEGWRGVSSHDQANAALAVADGLGVGPFSAVVGASYGGCVALAMASRHAQCAQRFLVISAAHRPAPMATALRVVQRRILDMGGIDGGDHDALALARALAMTTYRSEAEFQARFDLAPEWNGAGWSFPVEGYLMARGRAFASRPGAARAARVLSESLDLHRIDPAALPANLHLLGARQDRLVPAGDLRALACASGASLDLIDSAFGHDAFLKDTSQVARWLRRYLGGRGRMRRRA